jgi:hypothetical protein
MNLFFADSTVTITYDGIRWSAERTVHHIGAPLMEVLAYRPTIRRPFGHSRITRAVMSITDSAVREALRTEVAAEFYTTPQKYLLGADDGLFDEKMPREDTDGPVEGAINGPQRPAQMSRSAMWDAYIGSMFAITRDEQGELPTFGQLPQMTMQPHMDYMRSLAARFAGETNIPVSSLGIIHDNPASAEAIYAAKEDLIIEAQELNATNGRALKNLGLMVMSMLIGRPVDDLTDDERAIAPKFRNPAMPSVVSQSDAIIKQVTALPWLAETTVVLEELGYSAEQITRLLSDKRKASAYETVRSLSQPSPLTPSPTTVNTIPADGAGE